MGTNGEGMEDDETVGVGGGWGFALDRGKGKEGKKGLTRRRGGAEGESGVKVEVGFGVKDF